MLDNYFVSVVIPNYNYAHFVGDAIESVLSQAYKNYEIIIVDNGSTDNSRDVLERYRRKHPESIRLFYQANLGQAGSRNRGITESKGGLIAFLDADDVWLPEKLALQVPLFSDPDVGLVYCGSWIVDEDLNIIDRGKPRFRGHVLENFAVAGSLGVVNAGESSAVIRSECFKKVGYFDPELTSSTGWDMYRRIASLYQIDYIDKPLIKYRVHKHSAHHIYENMIKDIKLHVRKMFSDPLSSKTFHLRSKGFAKMHTSIAYIYMKNRRFILMAYHLFKGISVHHSALRTTLDAIKKRIV